MNVKNYVKNRVKYVKLIKMNIDEQIKKVVESVLSISDFSDESKISSDQILSWDSLRHIQLIFSLEEEFDIEFNDLEINEMINLKSINKLIKSKF